MLQNVKDKMFPCTKKIIRAIEENIRASERLMQACQPKTQQPKEKAHGKT